MLGNAAIGMGYVKKTYAAAGRQVEVLAEGRRVKAEVVGLPLWSRGAAESR
jgi:glycine cleavage system aminomethyltransferase T